MKRPIHHYPSVGSLVKRITEINPDLGVQEIMELIRQGTHTQGDSENEFLSADVVDEKKIIELAKATLK